MDWRSFEAGKRAGRRLNWEMALESRKLLSVRHSQMQPGCYWLIGAALHVISAHYMTPFHEFPVRTLTFNFQSHPQLRGLFDGESWNLELLMTFVSQLE